MKITLKISHFFNIWISYCIKKFLFLDSWIALQISQFFNVCIPDCICKLKNLRYLQLYSNKLTTLPNGLIFLNSLVELSLRDNPLVVKFVKQIDVQV